MNEPPVITSAEMRALEQDAIASGRVTGLALMERAGAGIVEAILQQWPDLESPRALVLCGPGNNGGDGFVVARLLRDLGWCVRLTCAVQLSSLKGDADINARRIAKQQSEVSAYSQTTFEHELEKPGTLIVIDAILGIGQTRPCDNLLEPFLTAWDHMSNVSPDNRLLCVSIDVPTGYDSDTGELRAVNPFEPDLTVTFHQMKPVHQRLLKDGYAVMVKGIGL